MNNGNLPIPEEGTQENISIIKPSVYLHPSLKYRLKDLVEEKSQVIIHCEYKGSNLAMEEHIRIWKSTYLFDLDSGKKSWLMHSENIAITPMWTKVPYAGSVRFTLFFEGLPKNCVLFDLIEAIPEQGAFHIENVKRNASDIYHLNFSSADI
ncbi:MAG TPA: hypothetical protein PKH65_01450 [Bacteroidia bacterium]|nr:hypothetical protein [Bacteroidia bacterium]HNT79320.1 hypothetical protein [Bacteroidia bacterium]